MQGEKSWYRSRTVLWLLGALLLQVLFVARLPKLLIEEGYIFAFCTNVCIILALIARLTSREVLTIKRKGLIKRFVFLFACFLVPVTGGCDTSRVFFVPPTAGAEVEYEAENVTTTTERPSKADPEKVERDIVSTTQIKATAKGEPNSKEGVQAVVSPDGSANFSSSGSLPSQVVEGPQDLSSYHWLAGLAIFLAAALLYFHKWIAAGIAGTAGVVFMLAPSFIESVGPYTGLIAGGVLIAGAVCWWGGNSGEATAAYCKAKKAFDKMMKKASQAGLTEEQRDSYRKQAIAIMRQANPKWDEAFLRLKGLI